MSDQEPLYKASEWGKIFHSLTVHEALGAGSAGPGKSLVLLMDPLEQITLEHNRCMEKNHPYRLRWGESSGWAVHFRRTMPMLEQTISRALKYFPRIDPNVTYDKQKHIFKFQSGYRYQFAHCAESSDYEGHQSAEYCVAGGTRIVMGDGSLKEIQHIVAGELVMTLEGPRRVVRTFDSGVKPCVRVDVLDRGVIVGTQVHPTTHPVLVQPNDVWLPSLSPRIRRDRLRCSPHGHAWQDYESFLCGLQESPVSRVSRVDAESGFGVSAGARLAPGLLPEWTFRAVLHEPTLRRCRWTPPTPTASRGIQARIEWWRRTAQARTMRVVSSLLDLEREPIASPRPQYRDAAPRAGDASCGQTASQTATDYGERCSWCLCLRDGQLPSGAGACQCSARRQGDASPREGFCCELGGEELTRTHTGPGAMFYPHFYGGECRPRTEAVHICDAEARFEGWFQTFDLTVEGANSYITESSIVNAQTHQGYDELTQFEEEQYDNLITRVRSADPMLKNMLKIRAASNPFFKRDQGVSIKVRDPHWVRKRFVDPAPKGGVVLKKRMTMKDGREEVRTRIYLPATLYDNPDPEFVRQYEAQLMNAPSHIRNAMLYGDWYATPGSFYGDDWIREVHICAPFKIPSDWRVIRSMDWGFKAHGCIMWAAINYEGQIVVFKELMFRGRSATQMALRVKEIEMSMGLWRGGRSGITGPADTQLWEQRGESGVSKAAEFAAVGVGWTKADKKSRATNAQRLLTRLQDRKAMVPGIMFFESCETIIKTLPGIQADANDPECPVDGGDDHAHDTVLYLCAYASHPGVGVSRDRVQERAEIDEDADVDVEVSAGRGRLGYGSRVQ